MIFKVNTQLDPSKWEQCPHFFNQITLTSKFCHHFQNKNLNTEAMAETGIEAVAESVTAMAMETTAVTE